MSTIEDVIIGLLGKLFGTGKNSEGTDDYGAASMPPSSKAEAFLADMTEEERSNFRDLLQHIQQWYDSNAGESPLRFHPEIRARFWGGSLAKIADHYRETGRYRRSLFFTRAAWNIYRHPMFAYNMASMFINSGDLNHAIIMLQTYLAEYQNVQTDNEAVMYGAPVITKEELEDMAKSARSKLAVIQSR